MKNNLSDQYIEESVDSIPKDLLSLDTEWESPSNIALIKYWGKSAGQIPKNPSLSFSLKEAVSRTKFSIAPSPAGIFELDFLFEGRENKSFESRIRSYLESLFPYFPFLKNSSVSVKTHNTFPHSSGIASSASAMSALALCLCSVEWKIKGAVRDPEFYQKASYMARLGSGSASRSVYGNFVSWGRAEGFKGTSDEYASPLDIPVGDAFRSLGDAVLIINPDKKKVSSSQGHALMHSNPFAVQRYKQAAENYSKLLDALRGNDIESFIRVTENEALTLHALMMSSDPGFILLEPSTLEILDRIRKFREETGSFITFTIDAGPNVHMIYSQESRDSVLQLIEDELKALCHNGEWIDDFMGEGPVEMDMKNNSN
jgi:diphosphomevalonate decarboxylase